MGSLLYWFPRVGPLLEAALVWRLLRKPLRYEYPYLGAYVSYSLIRDLALFPIVWYRPAWFGPVYWRAETVALFLGFGVDWEFFRHAFPRQSALHDLGRKALLFAGLALIPLMILLASKQALSLHRTYTYISPVFVQYVNLLQALLLAAPAAVASYYRVHLGRNLRGLGLGFGVYVSLHAINVANVEVFRGFFPWWRVLSPLTFLGMIAIWLRSFWEYSPAVAGNDSQERTVKVEFSSTKNHGDGED